jgi:hypothetical protein
MDTARCVYPSESYGNPVVNLSTHLCCPVCSLNPCVAVFVTSPPPHSEDSLMGWRKALPALHSIPHTITLIIVERLEPPDMDELCTTGWTHARYTRPTTPRRFPPCLVGGAQEDNSGSQQPEARRRRRPAPCDLHNARPQHAVRSSASLPQHCSWRARHHTAAPGPAATVNATCCGAAWSKLSRVAASVDAPWRVLKKVADRGALKDETKRGAVWVWLPAARCDDGARVPAVSARAALQVAISSATQNLSSCDGLEHAGLSECAVSWIQHEPPACPVPPHTFTGRRPRRGSTAIGIRLRARWWAAVQCVRHLCRLRVRIPLPRRSPLTANPGHVTRVDATLWYYQHVLS